MIKNRRPATFYLFHNQSIKMPQPPFEVRKYLAKPLPQIRESYPPGTGGTGPRAEWEGSLKGVEVIDDLNERVTKCMPAWIYV